MSRRRLTLWREALAVTFLLLGVGGACTREAVAADANPPAVAPAAPVAGPALPGAALGTLSDDIRDIRGPKFILPAWAVPAALAALLLIGLAVYGAIRWWRKRRRPRVLLPYERALKRLEEIRPLMQPETAREFSTAVSGVVRHYIEVRFNIIATHRTTEEFLHDLLQSSKGMLVQHRPLLSEFLQQCDLVKFAGISLTRENMESLYESARAFVLETAKPDPEVPPVTHAKEAHDSLPAA